MADEKQSVSDKPSPVMPPESGRRRLLRGGIAATPVLMTLVSRPVLGNSLSCTTGSAFTSISTSGNRKATECYGRTPEYWALEQTWPAPYLPVRYRSDPATKFTDVFKGVQSPYHDNTTLLDVLKIADQGPPHNVTRHCVASILNVASGKVTVFDESYVKEIWREFVANGGGSIGYFTPTAGIKWFHNYSQPTGLGGIVPYLKSTMTL